MFYIFFADGFEEVEAIATLDVIRRAGIEIESVGVGSKSITGAHGINVICDKEESEIKINGNLNGIILPGGMPGTTNLLNSKTVNDSIDYCNNNHLSKGQYYYWHKVINESTTSSVSQPVFAEVLFESNVSSSYDGIKINYKEVEMSISSKKDISLAVELIHALQRQC